jgi:hypothetical protein
MIKFLEFEFFQPYSYGCLELSPGVNVIIAPSDKGKTSIQRGVEWVRTNRPLGDVYNSWHAPEGAHTSFSICKTDGSLVGKSRLKGTTRYFVTKDDKELEFQEAVARDVPSEVTEVLNLSDINVQEQEAPYFLIQNSSPGEVAKLFNGLMGWNIIDRLFKNLDGKIRATRESEKSTEKLLKQSQAEFKGYAYLDEFQRRFDIVQARSRLYKNNMGTISSVRSILVAISIVNEDIDKLKKKTKLESRILTLMEKVEIFQNKNTKKEKLTVLVSDIKETEEILEAKEIIEELDNRLIQLTSKIADREKIQNNIRNLQSLVVSIKLAEKSVGEKTKIYENQKKLLESKVKEYKVCPFCGQPIKEDFHLC